MLVTGNCDIKINLTLRVLGKRDDGYHNICSLFWRRPSPEVVQADFCAGRDSLIVTGLEIPGENILVAACRYFRDTYGDDSLPPVKIVLHKCLPLGGGVGAGSGNAAIFLRLAGVVAGFGNDAAFPRIASLGSDVAFLAGGQNLAVVCGVGDVIHELGGGLDMRGIVFFPSWSADTASAYRALDEARAGGLRADVSAEEQARDEAMSILRDLRSGRKAGRIPNDFAACAGHDGEYALLEDIVSDSGALVWGLCGSGSGYFAFFGREEADAGMRGMFCSIRKKKETLNWLRQILVLE